MLKFLPQKEEVSIHESYITNDRADNHTTGGGGWEGGMVSDSQNNDGTYDDKGCGLTTTTVKIIRHKQKRRVLLFVSLETRC